MNLKPLLPTFLLGILLVLLSSHSARATTIIPVPDDDLALSSRAIVEGRCRAVEPVWSAEEGLVNTFVTFDVEVVHKGDLVPGPIVIKQMGGEAGPFQTVLWGAPYWQSGWRMLLFLNTDADGALVVAHLSLGYFRILRSDATGKDFVARPDFGARMLPAHGPGQVTDVAFRDEFVERLHAVLGARWEDARAYESRFDGIHLRTVPVDYAPTAKTGSGGGTSNFGFLGDGFRWFEPDTGGTVRYRVNPNQGPTPSSGRDEAAAAANAWGSVPGSSLRVEIPGETQLCGFKADGTSTISFGDCTGRIDDPVGCGGVVAIGGVTNGDPSQRSTIGGRSFIRIREADIVFNNGFDCLLAEPTATAEVMAHEMGHSLGFGHSSEKADEQNNLLRDALMFFRLHNDRRGARLGDDDMDAVRFLYRANNSAGIPTIVSDALPDAELGVPYDFTLKATGGAAPFTWSLDAGALPAGLALSPSGRITGTATADQAATFTVQLRDAANFVVTRVLTLRSTATPAPFITSVKFKAEQRKIVVKGFNLDDGLDVVVNGTTVTPPGVVKFKPEKGKLVVKGGAGNLNVRQQGPNRVFVRLSGMASNTFEF